MQESLGISISNQVIKYAKVTKNNNQLSVASCGIKFYDDLTKNISQIINETNSINIPICINTQDEKISYYSIFNLLSKNDMKKTINTEFESTCADEHINPNAYEGRYVVVNDIDNKDRNRVIFIYEGKNNLEEINSYVNKGKIKSITPVATSITNIADTKKGENVMIVNIENDTTITTILNQKVYSIDKIPYGMKEPLENINEKENSYMKSYEACKNTTIYTMETPDMLEGTNQYLSFILPQLYSIANEILKMKQKYPKIDKIYLTGLATAVNNIELYFQEYFRDSKCEILKPFFAQNDSKINIKDYIEVNSAIALAMEGLDYGLKSLNFKASNWKDDLNTLLHSDIKSIGKGSKGAKKPSFKFDMNLRGKLTRSEMWLVRSMATVILVIVVFSGCSLFLGTQILEKTQETKDVIQDTNKQIAAVNSDDTKVLSKTKDYQSIVSGLNDASSQAETKRSRKNQIPTLLNQIVYCIPKSVQLVKIVNTQNTDGTQHIALTAQSKQYEQLAYFKAKLNNNGYLLNVTSTEGTKTGEYVVVSIEGDLP